jgi:hypothetical protein
MDNKKFQTILRMGPMLIAYILILFSTAYHYKQVDENTRILWSISYGIAVLVFKSVLFP